jgi:hypothetical protein
VKTEPASPSFVNAPEQQVMSHVATSHTLPETRHGVPVELLELEAVLVDEPDVAVDPVAEVVVVAPTLLPVVDELEAPPTPAPVSLQAPTKTQVAAARMQPRRTAER